METNTRHETTKHVQSLKPRIWPSQSIWINLYISCPISKKKQSSLETLGTSQSWFILRPSCWTRNPSHRGRRYLAPGIPWCHWAWLRSMAPWLVFRSRGNTIITCHWESSSVRLHIITHIFQDTDHGDQRFWGALFSYRTGWLVWRQLFWMMIGLDVSPKMPLTKSKTTWRWLQLSVANHPFEWHFLRISKHPMVLSCQLSPIFSGQAPVLLGHNAQHSPQHFGRDHPEMEKSSASECPLRLGIIPKKPW